MLVLPLMVHVPLVDLKRQYHSIKADIDKAISGVLENSTFILGEGVKDLEHAFAEFCEVKYCVGMNSGTDALLMALQLLGIGPGDEVITTPHTFIATVLAIFRAGATVKLVDVDPTTYTIDPLLLRKAVTPKTKAIMPVHLYGHPAKMDEILEIAAKSDLAVIEDACQAHGATFKGKRVGSIGNVGCFSFYPSKNLGGYGDGGALVTNNKELVEKAAILRNQGERVKYDQPMRGINSRLDGIQAAILRVKLRHLEQWNKQRRAHAQLYNELLGDTVVCPTEAAWATHVYHLYAIRTKYQQQLLQHLRSQDIGCGLYYPKLANQQEAFKDMDYLGYGSGSFPVAEPLCKEIVALPMFAELTDEEIQHVAEQVKKGIRLTG